MPPGGLHVDVDVRQCGATSGEETFEDQIMLYRIYGTDSQQVVHQGGGAGASRRDPHPHLLDHVHHLRHGEEVTGETQVPDDCQLMVKPVPDP